MLFLCARGWRGAASEYARAAFSVPPGQQFARSGRPAAHPL